MFWMVIGSGVPNFRHDSLESAKKEAERLAKQQPGQGFTVLESVATVKTVGVSWEELRVDKPEEDPKALPSYWKLLSSTDVFVSGDRVTYQGNKADSSWEILLDKYWLGRKVCEWASDRAYCFAARDMRPF